MIARQGSILSWHFAHYESASCGGMTWLHRSAQEVLRGERRITLSNPDYVFGELILEFAEVTLEVTLDGRIVDCLCVMEDGYELIVEIRVTHQVEDSKLADLISANSNRDVIEMDLRPYKSQSLDWLSLTSAVCDTSQNVRWLHHTVPHVAKSEEVNSESGAARKTAVANWIRLLAKISAMNAAPPPLRSRRSQPKRSTKSGGRRRSPKARKSIYRSRK